MRAIVLAFAALFSLPLASCDKIPQGESVYSLLTTGKTCRDPRGRFAKCKTCPDGSRIWEGAACPVPPPPAVSLAGLPPIASNFDVNLAINAQGGVPTSGVPDVVGAFRFLCSAGQINRDDPILYPGQPGKSHLHQYYGNVTADAFSTYESLRKAGDSTCNWTGQGVALNRSAYWMPAMLDGKGNVVRPDFVSIYYKRRPISDPKCNPANPQAEGICVDLPNGLKFIFGWDPTGVNQIKTGGLWFNCQGPTAKPDHYADLTNVKEWCGPGNQLGAVINAPECWDGKNLDSPDHRSHVAYASYGGWGYLKCPSTHPYVIPTFTLGAWYSVANDDPSLWELSSDHMAPGKPRGYTFHADFLMAWDAGAAKIWHDNCINKLLSCVGGQLGNGKDLKGAGQPIYNGVTSWKHPQRLVPIPS